MLFVFSACSVFQIFANFCLFLMNWKNSVKVKNSTKLDKFAKFVDIYNIITDLNAGDFLIFNCSPTAALHRTPPMLFSVETKKSLFKDIIFKSYQRSFKSISQNFPSLNIMSECLLRVHITANVVTWNNKAWFPSRVISS